MRSSLFGYLLFIGGSAGVAVVAGSCAPAGCSSGVGVDGPVVGSTCTETLDCANGSVCNLDTTDFPNGMCTKSCKNAGECPEDTRCVDVQGGLCLLACAGGQPCPEGVRCRNKPNKGDTADSDICINDDD